ncbi:MAG: hypothetical protein AAGG45_02680 [Pseudomonadota bacterium]
MSDLRLRGFSVWIPWLLGAVFIALQARAAGDIVLGLFPDNDDMLRLQQVRDLLAGQSWFNVDQSRFLTPEGGEMHWSRLPDIVIAGLILLTRPFLGPAGAESFALVVYPLILFGVALATVRAIAERLGAGLPGQAVAMVLFGLSSVAYNFWPGRIDHHNLVVLFTLIAFAALLSPRLSVRSGVIAALSIVASISVAIEGLPYAGALILSFGVFWIVRGHSEGVRLTVFGVSIAVFAVVFLILDAPGISVRRAVCDAYGVSHFAALSGGGLLLATLGVFGGWFDSWQKRLIAGALAGAITLILFVAINPDCLGDPYAEVSEQVRVGWLSVVGEARSLMAVWYGEPRRAVWQFGFVIAGLVATTIVVLTSSPQQRLGHLSLALLMLLSTLASVWQIRGVTFAHPFAAIAGGLVLGVLFMRWQEKGGVGRLLQFAGLVIFMAPISWEILSNQFVDEAAEAQKNNVDGIAYNVVCLDPPSYLALGELPPAKVLTPIDLGVSLLVRSEHSVYGGPYHRNVLGIERVTRTFMSEPDVALDEIRAMGATHVLYCAGANETARYALLMPGSFADEMEQGRVPDWLQPADDAAGYDGIVRLYRVIAD